MGCSWEGMDDRIKLVSITKGADFEIDLSRFEGPQPRFAYVDDCGGRVEILHGLALSDRIVIPAPRGTLWLPAPRDCLVLRGTVPGKASFRSLTVGEFRVEIYFLGLNGEIELIHENDFCFK